MSQYIFLCPGLTILQMRINLIIYPYGRCILPDVFKACSPCETVENKSSRIVKLSVPADISSARQIVKAILSRRAVRNVSFCVRQPAMIASESFSSTRDCILFGKVATPCAFESPTPTIAPFIPGIPLRLRSLRTPLKFYTVGKSELYIITLA